MATLTRRAFLGTAVATAGALVASQPAAHADASDPFDALRARWRESIIGGEIDPNDPAVAAALRALDAAVVTAVSHVDSSTERTAVFTDYPLGTTSANVSGTYTRLATMTTAYVTPGAARHGDAALLTTVLAGLRTVHDHAYNDNQREYDNWWDWEIGSPKLLNDICVMLGDALPADQLAATIAAVDHFVPDPTTMFPPERGPITSTGANRVDLCQVVAIRGILGRSPDKVAAARDGLPDVFGYVTAGDGFYADGSFVQHTHVAYTGTYGVVLLSGTGKLLALLAGSPWAVTDPRRQVLFDAVDRTFAPVVHDGAMMDFVRGRAVSRSSATDHDDGHAAIEAILRLGAAVDAATADRWRARCLGWLRRDTSSDIRTGASIPRLALVGPLLADASIRPLPEPPGPVLFAGMDRAVHRRPGWAYGISMASERIAYYEYGNGENIRGWHQGDGMTYLHDADHTQFSDEFWPTVDPYRLPGTTVDSQRLADGIGGDFGTAVAPTSFAGGAVVDGRYAAVGQDLVGFGSTMRARKSWFCLDDMVVALGGGICGGSGQPIETILENRALHDGDNALLVDGVRQPGQQDWTDTFDRARWAHVDRVGGYVLLGRHAPLRALREERTGSWSQIKTGASTTAYTRRYLTLWFDHGANPRNGSYAYLLLPGATAAATARRAARPGVAILAGDADRHAIAAPGLLAANFFAAGSLGGAALHLSVDAPCSVLARLHRDSVTVAVADPTHRADSVTLAVGRRRLTVDCSDHDGRTHTVRLSL